VLRAFDYYCAIGDREGNSAFAIQSNAYVAPRAVF
jgi:hypothetical protein